MILGFDENFEAKIEAQYPSNLSESFNLKASDLMNIYTLHRMDKNEPNFFQMEIKDFTVASFFTGFSLKHYVGVPDYAITIFFTNEEITRGESSIDFDLEGKIRRIANELLPKKDEQDFKELLRNYYVKLEKKELEPYWDEYNEDEITKLVSLPTEGVSTPSPAELEPQSQKEIDDADYYKLENEALKTEIESLELLLKEKNEKIKELSKKESVSESVDVEEWKSKYKKLEEYNEILTDNIDKLTEMSSKYNEEIKKQNTNVNELTKKVESKDTLINELTRKLEKLNKEMEVPKESKDNAVEYFQVIEVLKKENKELKQENETLKKDNEIHLDSIADLKLQLREFKEKVSSDVSTQDNLSEEIIDLKKEIKVLRRERDHYKEIIKEHNLL